MDAFKTWLIQLVLGLAGQFIQQAFQRLMDLFTEKLDGKVSKDRMDEVLQIAKGHVEALLSDDIPGEEKKRIAFENVKIAVNSLKYDVPTGIINLAIELAYNALEAVAEERKAKASANN